MKITNQFLITDPIQILSLDIIDFNRLNGIWENSGDAMKTIFSWFNNRATVTEIIIDDYESAPVRGDFPEKMLSTNDIWITLKGDGDHQVIIESHFDMRNRK